MVASFHNNSKFLIRALMMISRAHGRISLDIDIFLAEYILFMLRIFPMNGFSTFCHSLLSNLYNIGSNAKYPMSANHIEHEYGTYEILYEISLQALLSIVFIIFPVV